MASRRNFLKTLAATAAGFTGITTVLPGCAGAIATYRTEAKNGVVRIQRAEVPELEMPNGVINVRAGNFPEPIILRNLPEHGIVAVSSMCTHRGCELRALPNSLQCPCHGSEYDEFGQILNGPATKPLRRFEVEETEQAVLIKLS